MMKRLLHKCNVRIKEARPSQGALPGIHRTLGTQCLLSRAEQFCQLNKALLPCIILRGTLTNSSFQLFTRNFLINHQIILVLSSAIMQFYASLTLLISCATIPPSSNPLPPSTFFLLSDCRNLPNLPGFDADISFSGRLSHFCPSWNSIPLSSLFPFRSKLHSFCSIAS